MFHACIADKTRASEELGGVGEARGHSNTYGEHAAKVSGGSPGVFAGHIIANLLQDDDGKLP